jgi:hypothetical protein
MMAWLVHVLAGNTGWLVQFILSEVATLVVREGAYMVKTLVCHVVCRSTKQAVDAKSTSAGAAAILAYRHSLLKSP